MFTFYSFVGIVLLAAAAFSTPAQAGRSCDGAKPGTRSIERGLDLAGRTSAALEASGAQVVLLARAGQDLSKYGVRYSHLGFAYRHADPGGQAPVWRVVHKLNHCGTADAALYRQGLGQFFLDDPWRYETAWVIPNRELQDKLLPLLQDSGRVALLHHRPYSIVSYAWGRRYQQSNQWVIETVAAAAEPAALTRERAQAWLLLKGYQPTTLRLGPLTRVGARAGSANVAFDDHPDDKRFSSRIETVTVDSVFGWLTRSGLGGSPVSLSLPLERTP